MKAAYISLGEYGRFLDSLALVCGVSRLDRTACRSASCEVDGLGDDVAVVDHCGMVFTGRAQTIVGRVDAEDPED